VAGLAAREGGLAGGQVGGRQDRAPVDRQGGFSRARSRLVRRIDEIAHLFGLLGVVDHARNLLDHQDRKGGAQARAHNLVPLQIAAHSASSHPVSR